MIGVYVMETDDHLLVNNILAYDAYENNDRKHTKQRQKATYFLVSYVRF